MSRKAQCCWLWSSLRTKSLAISCRIARPQHSLSKVKDKTHFSVIVDTRLSQHQVRSISLCSNDPTLWPYPVKTQSHLGAMEGTTLVNMAKLLHQVYSMSSYSSSLHLHSTPTFPSTPPPPLFFHPPPLPPLHSYIPILPIYPPLPVPRQAQTHLGVMEGTTLLNLVKSHHQVSWILPYCSSPPTSTPLPPTTPTPPPPTTTLLQTSTNSLGCHGRHHVVEPGEVTAPSLLDLVVLLQSDEAVTPQYVTRRVARARLAQLPCRLDGSLQEDEDVELLPHHLVRPHAVEGRVRG